VGHKKENAPTGEIYCTRSEHLVELKGVGEPGDEQSEYQLERGDKPEAGSKSKKTKVKECASSAFEGSWWGGFRLHNTQTLLMRRSLFIKEGRVTMEGGHKQLRGQLGFGSR